MMLTREEISQAVQLYIENVKIKGDNNKVGTIGLDEEAVCEMLCDAVTSLSARIEENGQEVTEAVFEKLFGIIHSNMICTISELSDAQKVSEESIKKAIRQNFDALTENMTDFVDRIYNELQKMRQSIPDLQNAIEQLSEKCEKQASEMVSIVEKVREEICETVIRDGKETRETVIQVGQEHQEYMEEFKDELFVKIEKLREEILKNNSDLGRRDISDIERDSLQKQNEELKIELEKLQKELELRKQKEDDWLNKPLNKIQIPQNVSGRIKKLFIAAKEGNKEAQCNLGSCYEEGRKITQDPMRAAYWYKQSAENGYAEAQFMLGEYYRCGEGVGQDSQEAFKWYQRAAEQNHADALNNLGWCYHHGKGVEKNYRKAIELYTKAVALNEPYAHANLGECYENGLEVEKNKDIAFSYYNKAVELDSECRFAWEHLANCYAKGIGTQKNDKMSEICKRYAAGKLTVAESTEKGISILFDFIGVVSIIFGYFFVTAYFNTGVLFPGRSGFIWLALEIAIPFALILFTIVLDILIEKYIKKNHRAKSRSRSWVRGTAILLTISSCCFVSLMPILGRVKSYDIEQDGLYYNFQESGTLEVCNNDTKRREIIIPKEVNGISVTSIGKAAFWFCDKLESITIPESITSIGGQAFQRCNSLKEVYFNAIACQDLENGTNTFVRDAGDENGISVIIGKNVTRIPMFLFSDYTEDWSNDIISVTFEEGSVCNSIGQYAFDGCDKLESINLPDALTNIDYHAFNNCTKLTSIFIPSSVTTITYHAFDGCENLTIYCEVTEKPSGWASNWNYDNRPVVWGAKREV